MSDAVYHPISRGFHWLIGLSMIAMLALGVYMTDLPSSPGKFALYGFHKSIGMILLGLVILRIIWRQISPPPAALASHAPWEKRLAGLVHILLYGGMILMPVSGYGLSTAAGYPVSIFGWVRVPALFEKDVMLIGYFRSLHEFGGYTIMAAVMLHITGALKHHFYDRDTTLKRMLPFLKRSSS
jgi:cytochrome b561